MTRRLAVMVAAALLAAGPAQAGLLGHNVTLNYDFDVLPTFTDVIAVGAGVEVTCPGAFNLCSALTAPVQAVDFGDTTITYSYTSTNGSPAGFNTVTPNGFTFGGLNVEGEVLSVALSTRIARLDLSRVLFTPSSVTVDMHGLALGSGAHFTLSLAIPEPATALLLSVAAMIGVTAGRRVSYRLA